MALAYIPLDSIQYSFLSRLDQNQEVGLATWFSQTLLFISAVAGLTIAEITRRKKDIKHASPWLILGGILLFFSIDEGQQIHELFVRPAQLLFHVDGGAFGVGWTIFGLLFIAIALVILWKPLRYLPARTKKLLLLASVCFFGGAIGVETIASYVATDHSIITDIINGRPVYNVATYIPFIFLFTLEESLELIGASLFVYMSLDYLRGKKVSLDVGAK